MYTLKISYFRDEGRGVSHFIITLNTSKKHLDKNKKMASAVYLPKLCDLSSKLMVLSYPSVVGYAGSSPLIGK